MFQPEYKIKRDYLLLLLNFLSSFTSLLNKEKTALLRVKNQMAADLEKLLTHREVIFLFLCYYHKLHFLSLLSFKPWEKMVEFSLILSGFVVVCFFSA